MSLLRLKQLSTNDPFWESLLKEIIGRITQVEPLAIVILFGSFIENRFTAESDLDVAVIIPDNGNPKIFLRKIYEPGRLSRLLQYRRSSGYSFN
jgi:predicted nucleotidyltransferase